MASGTPSGASQRLLTMKFMQRAAAASSPTSPSTTTSDDGHSSKRRKTAGRSSMGEPETSSYVIDQKAARAALDEEERKRQVAIAKVAEQLGDGHWVLDAAKLPRSDRQAVAPLKTVQVGFSQIDRRGGLEDDSDNTDTSTADGPSFRAYGPEKKVQRDKASSYAQRTGVPKYADLFPLSPLPQSNSDSDSDSDSDDSDSSDSSDEDSSEEVTQEQPGRASYGAQKRDELRSKQNAERERARKLSSQRREKVVKLNKLTSISGAGSYSSKGKPGRR
ncbi:hypothetical protein M406DRAFT_335723 [Cryphonectria parasitica EP155]|uniref:Uncharacterized protein n=1 Tax=Cryphonectria parasitica (strain ATCC 38755 / EP155) TaxID=660469 RepID=A0A9P5CTZ4_CRYP1|nr:uncharacterized protein M406DRAFT_335723 [Cryphonectria parasitica EP155]KAF3769956.1 hypothetical protein M406DRAFT_335723 [Cryphonectria parasitica EP155]